MNKDLFFNELRKSLSYLPSEEREEILYDYEEHFQVGLEAGKSEEEIIRSLGSPQNIARQYKASYAVSVAEDNTSTTNVLRALIAIVSLGFFNLVFVLGPFLAAVGILIGFFAASIGIVITGISMFVGLFAGSTVFPDLASYISIPEPLSTNILGTVFLSLGLTSLGSLLLIGNCYLSKFFATLTVKYLKFNLKIIQR